MSPQRPAVLLALLALAWPSTAGAAPTEPLGYPAQQPSADTQLRTEVQLAERFWAARDVVGCPDGINIDMADTLTVGAEAAVGRGGACRVVFARDKVAALRRQSVRSLVECGMVFHEVGHALGLEHTATGVMNPGFDTGRADVPWECSKWSKQVRHRATVARRKMTLNRHSGRGSVKRLRPRRGPRA